MIIMVNGAFGVGKTTVSNELLKKVENCMIYDPEEVGFMLRNILPTDIQQIEADSGDFQDFDLWTELTVQIASALISKYEKHLIVPMTIRNPDYLASIKEGLNKIDGNTYHFCLTASKDTIHERLKKRGEQEGDWCFRQTNKCLMAFGKYDFGEYIDTDYTSITSVVDDIIQRINPLSLK